MFKFNSVTSALALAVFATACAAPSPSETQSETAAATPSLETADLTQAPIEITADMPTAGTNLIDLYTYFHMNPELSFKEVKSSTIMAKELESLGWV